MKRNIFLLIVLLILGGLAWWLYQKQSPTTLSEKPLAQFSLEDTAAVTKFSIFDPITGKNSYSTPRLTLHLFGTVKRQVLCPSGNG